MGMLKDTWDGLKRVAAKDLKTIGNAVINSKAAAAFNLVVGAGGAIAGTGVAGGGLYVLGAGMATTPELTVLSVAAIALGGSTARHAYQVFKASCARLAV